MKKQIQVSHSETSKKLSEQFDYPLNETVTFECKDFKPPSDSFNIGLIVGPSGSGKSSILTEIQKEKKIDWDFSKPICDHFNDSEEAKRCLSSVGLNCIPTWFKPFHVLSNGEKFRADLSRKLKDNATIDEFTSVVDRSVAKSCSYSVQRHIRKYDIKSVIFASCHYDIIDWLNPDWVYDTKTEKYSPRGCLCRPKITLELFPCRVEAWAMFRKHHYLTGDINHSSSHWIVCWGSDVIGFTSAIAMPSGTLKNSYRGHRTVLLPDFQGLGLGVRVSDALGEIFLSRGKRFFSKTPHPRMGEYRNKSKLWRPTSKNMITRSESGANKNLKWEVRKVFSYSHEYVGKEDRN